MVASSAVTIPAVSRAAATTASTSSGLTVGIESTRAEMPSLGELLGRGQRPPRARCRC